MEANSVNRIPKHNKSARPMLAYIDANPGCTINEICGDTGIKRDTAEYNANMLVGMGLIHVSDWEMPKGRSSPSRMFVMGPGTNAPFPRRGIAFRRAVKRRSDAKRRHKKRIIQATEQMGPFGIVAAQIMRGNHANTTTR